MASVEYLVNLAEAQADPALAAAFGRAGQPAPFDRLEWWRALGEECLPGEGIRVAVARDGASLAALPLMRRGRHRQLRSVAHWYSFWARPVFSGAGDREALLRVIAKALPSQAARVSLAPLPADDAAAVERAFAAAGWRVLRSIADRNHRLDLAGRDFAAYWAARPGQLRETVRRKAKGPVELRIAERFDPADWADYETVYSASWKPEEGSPRFLRRFAQAEGAAGTLRLGIATIEGRPVAAQLWTVEAGTAYIHKLAHDEAARRHSPGTLLSHAMFAHAIDRDKVATIDFGTGDDPYKRDWMEQAREMIRLDMHWPRSPWAWPHLLRARLRRLVSPSRHG